MGSGLAWPGEGTTILTIALRTGRCSWRHHPRALRRPRRRLRHPNRLHRSPRCGRAVRHRLHDRRGRPVAELALLCQQHSDTRLRAVPDRGTHVRLLFIDPAGEASDATKRTRATSPDR